MKRSSLDVGWRPRLVWATAIAIACGCSPSGQGGSENRPDAREATRDARSEDAMCGHGCGSDACLAGSCCPAAQVCGDDCCSEGSVCVEDDLGNKSCAQACTSSDQCSDSAPCCAVLQDGTSACVANASHGGQCRCTTGTECSSGACAPATDASGAPVGPYICVPNDGAPYDGCVGAFTDCAGAYCCVADSYGNEFCAALCVSSSTCGGAECNAYDFSHTTCGGPTACGPS